MSDDDGETDEKTRDDGGGTGDGVAPDGEALHPCREHVVRHGKHKPYDHRYQRQRQNPSDPMCVTYTGPRLLVLSPFCPPCHPALP